MHFKIFLLIFLVFLLGCQPKTAEISESKTEKQEVKPVTENPTNLGLSTDVIQKINNEMGLGNLFKWENDADPGSLLIILQH